VRPVAILKKQFDAYRLHHPLEPLATITDMGFVLGAGTQLMRIEKDALGLSRLALTQDEARLFALLAVAFRRPAAPDILHHLEDASAHWQRGDRALANIRLAFARLPRLESETDAWCLHLAGSMLDDGFSPRRLLREFGYPPTPSTIRKYDPNQPRVPAGSGRGSGQWTSGDGGTSAARDVAAVATRSSSLLGELGTDALSGLATLASRLALPAALFGAIFIPSPNPGLLSEGTLPGEPNIAYSADHDTGTLSLTTRGQDGSVATVHAQLQNGVYVDVASGKTLGRNLDGSIYIDRDAAAAALRDQGARAGEGADAVAQQKDDEPKLCPAPEKDRGHGSSDRANDYEDDVHARVNPSNPLARGLAVKLLNPVTGKYVYFDDCFQDHGDLVDGDMQKGDLVDAKGERYEELLQNPITKQKTISGLFAQAQRQTEAALPQGRNIKWYFAEKGASDYVRELFGRKYRAIVVGYMRPTKPSKRRKRK
jgi:hypothetical protein